MARIFALDSGVFHCLLFIVFVTTYRPTEAWFGGWFTGLSYPVDCTEGQVACVGGGECIKAGLLCDGNVDCQDGTDETECVGDAWRCPVGEFQCQDDGQCLPNSYACDGTFDCEDGSDEHQCDHKKCHFGEEFMCRSDRNCIRQSMRCDGLQHCMDGSDEENCTAASNLTSRQSLNTTEATLKSTEPYTALPPTSIAKSNPTNDLRVSTIQQVPGGRSTHRRAIKVSLLQRRMTTKEDRWTLDHSRSTLLPRVGPAGDPGNVATVVERSHDVNDVRGNNTRRLDGHYGGIGNKAVLLFIVGLGLTLVISLAAVCLLVAYRLHKCSRAKMAERSKSENFSSSWQTSFSEYISGRRWEEDGNRATSDVYLLKPVLYFTEKSF